jgi:hypothetical protein
MVAAPRSVFLRGEYASSCARPGPICCTKSSVSADFESAHGIFLTVRGRPSFGDPRGAKGIFAMFEAVTAVLGLVSVGVFLAHAFEGVRSRA